MKGIRIGSKGMAANRARVATVAAIIAFVVVIAAGCATGRSGVVATGMIEVHTWAAGVLYVDGSPVAELAAGEQHVQEHEWGTVRLQMRFGDGSRETQRVEVATVEAVRVEFAAPQLGDTGPAGGWIFYIDVDDEYDWTYLEAAPVETEWTGKPWGGRQTLVGGTGEAVDSGAANTAAIVDAYGANEPDARRSDYAAKLANELVYNGYSDWFLPSRDELDLMYQNLYLEDIGGFASAAYWSSSEGNALYAWEQLFSSGLQYNYRKGLESRVRAARAF